jgi:integrase
VARFLSTLAVRDGVASSTQNQALAVLFLYAHVVGRPLARLEGIVPARRPRRLPVVPSQREVRAILSQLQDPSRLCVSLMYGSGLRVSECMGMRVKDVNFDRRETTVLEGKGNKGRRVPLPESCVRPLHDRLAHEERRSDVTLRGR